VYFPEIKKNICRIFFGFEFISFPNRGLLSAAPCNCRLNWCVGRLTSVAQCYDDAEVSSVSVASLRLCHIPSFTGQWYSSYFAVHRNLTVGI